MRKAKFFGLFLPEVSGFWADEETGASGARRESLVQPMAWVRKGSGAYYYRNRWAGGTCISEYIGSGATAEHIARLDQLERLEREQERLAWREEVAQEDAVDRELDSHADLVQAITKAVLLANGCHQHRRQWRVIRREQSK